MPQIKSEHRGAMTNFLAARGVTSTAETVDAATLKPTQREFSPAKVKQAAAFIGTDRPILVSSDGHILDGHHQWLAKAQQDAPVKITRLSAPIADLLTAMKDFPSAGMTKDAEPFTPKANEKTTQTQSQQTQQQEAPAGELKLVLAPQNVAAEPVSASNPGNAPVRLRRAQMQRMAKSGFTRIENRGGQMMMVNPTRNEAMLLTGGPAGVNVTLAQQAIAALPKTDDNVALGQTNGLLPAGATKDTGTTPGATVAGVGSPDRGGQEVSGIPVQSGTRLWDPETESFNALGAALQNATRDAADVAITGPTVGSSAVALAPEDDARTQQLNGLLNVFGGFLGRRGVAISDARARGADDGMNDPETGRYYVNIDNAQMAPSRTVVHEGSHNMEDLPEVWAVYHKMWKLVPDRVRKAYFEGYMEQGTSFDATRAKAAVGNDDARNLMDKLKREMMADFMSGNFHDKLWLEALAKRKPYLFQKFIEEWIPLLGDMADLVTDVVRKLEARRGTPSSLRLKDIDALMVLHGAEKNLQAMKELAMDVAEAWATKNPGLAAKSNVSGVVQYAKRAGPDQWRPRDNFVVPEVEGFGNTGNIMTLPAFQVTNKDGRLLSYPQLPVRISIGQHGVSSQDQFGAQHRMDNALEKPMERGYKTPYLAGGDAAKVERAVRDIAASILGASVVYADKKSPEFAVMYDRETSHATVLHRTTDKAGNGYWSVKSVIPKKTAQMQYEYGNPAPIKGPTLDGVEPQQFNAIHRGILNKLRGPGIDLSTSEAYILSDIGLIVNPTANIGGEKATAKPKTAAEISEAKARMRAKLFGKKGDIQKSERETLQQDIAEQEKWLSFEARSYGYKDVDDLFMQNGDLFNELAKLWREQRPAEMLLSKRDELQAELDAEMNGNDMGVALDVSLADVKTKGIMAEAAYQPVAWRAAKGSMGTQYVADIDSLRVNGRAERLEMNEDSRSGLWDLGFPGTWVGPSMGERDGYASKKAVQAFAQRQVAARDLKLQGFDLASTLTPQQQYDLLDTWRTMERAPTEGPTNGAHKYAGIQAASQSLKEIAADMGITQDYDLVIEREVHGPSTSSFNLTFKHKASGAEFGARIDQHQAEGKKFLTANTLEMGKGGLGAAFYQMAAEYAARRNMPLRPESSLSGINSYRRTEQQLSAALRTGKSNAMVPHPVQRVYGFEDNASRKESHDANLVRLILAGLRNAKELVKDFAKLRYVPETGEFTDAKGKSREAAVQKLLADVDVRAFGMGRSTLARALLTQQALDGAKAPTNFKEPILYSARDTAALEYQAVIDQHQGTDAWMKAPNGQPTLLTERQWVQVRTPSFKAWFGDWEAGNIWSRDDVSKAVDENGEPLVVYHGTDKGGFMAFNQPGGDGRGDLGIFTTPNRDMARSYIRKGREQDMTPPTDAAVLEEIGIEVAPYQGRTSSRDTEDRALYGYTTPSGDEVSGFLTREEAVKSAIDDSDDVEFEKKSGIYAVFMNIRNPNEDDFEGALWTGSREHLWQVVDADGNTRESGGKIYMEEDEARALAKTLAEPDDEHEGADFMQHADDHWNDTDGLVREAARMKNDGAIVRNVVDDGGGRSNYDNEPSDVFVALRPEMLKSADFNTGEFGLSRDLRYSKRDTSGINPEVLAAIPEVAKLAAHLTQAEKSKLRVDTTQKMVDLYKALPSADEMAAVAYAGKAKRFWYRNSLSAIAHVFGADGWRFTGLLAAMSPQVSVETNLLNALNTWKNWVAAGRPTDRAEIMAVMGRSVQGSRGEDSVLNVWINNAVSALTAKDFADLVLSGPKVDSFMRNLLGHYYEVTNDAWIANYTLMDQRIFSGVKNKTGTEPGKGPGYLAMNVQTRKAAKKMDWQPAEVQETVWSWAMSMLETMDKQGETRGSKELLSDGAMTDDLINRTPDFRSLFHLPVYANILEQAGHHDALADLVAPHTTEDHGPMPFGQKKMDKLLHQAGLRLEFLQRQRRTNVQLSWEARPGESTGVLPGIHAAPIELQQQYMSDIYAAIESSGFYDKTGLSLRATLFGLGAWQGKVLPGAQTMTRPGIVADNKGGLMVDSKSRAKINVAASVLGIVLNQEGVYWHYPIYADKVENANGIEINFDRSLTNDEMSQLYGIIITKAGHADWAPANTPTGVRVLNFSGVANKDFHKTLQSALKQFSRQFEGDSSSRMFGSDGDALENNWKEHQDGQAYRSRLSEAGRSDLLGWIGDVLQPAIDQVNRRYSAEYGWGAATRGDTQRSAREGGPGGRRRPSDAATVRQAVHFGQRPGLSQPSGLSNGTGTRGAEDLRLKEATDPRIQRRVYFYNPVPGGIPQPEAGLGGNVYQTDLDNLYDPSTATRPLQGSGNAFESSVLDAGYDGYMEPTSGVIVMLGRDVPVKQSGNVVDFKLIPRVAKQVVMPTRTTVSGNELVRKPEGRETMALIKNRAALAKAAPSFKMEYGFARVAKDQAADFDQAMAALGSAFRFTENAAPIAAPDGLPNSKIEVKQTLAQRAATMRELLDCLS